MNKKIFVFFVAFLMFNVLVVKAIEDEVDVIDTEKIELGECTTEEMVRLKELAKNVEINYHYHEEERDADSEEDEEIDYTSGYFTIEILNAHEDLFFELKSSDTEYDELDVTNPEYATEYHFNEGESISLKITAYSETGCITKLLRTINVKIPYYNPYYYRHKEECKKYPDFKYCKEYIDKDISDKEDSEIGKELREYLKESPSGNSILTKGNQIYYIVGGVVLLVVVIAFIFMKNKNKKEKI